MKEVNECLKRIAAKYVEGCVDYYETAQPPNVWQQAFDTLENAMLTGEVDHIQTQLIWFDSTIDELLTHYKKLKDRMDLFYGK